MDFISLGILLKVSASVSNLALDPKLHQPKMNKLQAKLTRLKTILTKKPQSSGSSIPTQESLYLSVLQVVYLPIIASEKSSTLKNAGEVKPGPISVVKDSTIFISLPSMTRFKENVATRTSIMETIDTLEAKVFARSGKRALELVFSNIAPMTDIKVLVDQLSFVASVQAKGVLQEEATKSFEEINPTELDEYLIKVMELFVSVLKASIESAETTSYEVRKHQLFNVQNLKPVISKYFLTASQILGETGGNLALGVRDLFDISQSDHANALRALKTSHTPGAVFKNLTNSLKLVTRGHLDGYQRDDFETPQAYSVFIERETKFLSSLADLYATNFPDCVAQSNTVSLPTHLPPDQKSAEKFYKILLTLCFDRDLAESGSANLSKLSKEILNECSIAWNIFYDFKDASLFDATIKKYAAGKVGLNEILPVFKSTMRLSSAPQLLRSTDKDLILKTCQKLRISLCAQMQQFLEMVNLTRLTPDDCMESLRTVSYMVAELHSDPLCTSSPSLPALSKEQVEADIAEEIQFSARARIDYIFERVEQAFPGEKNKLTRLNKITQSFASDLRKFKLNYFDPILVSKTIYQIAGDEYIKTANTLVNDIATVDPETPMVQILELYDLFRELYDFCLEIKVDKEKMTVVEAHFLPVIDSWLTKTDSKWVEWVVRAYAVDNFEPISSPKKMNSTSVLDVFSAFQSALSFVSKFRFDDVKKREQLKQRFITAMHKTLETYCLLTFEDFDEIEKPNRSLPLEPKHIIKFNNILFAQELIEKLLDQLEVSDKLITSRPVNREALIKEKIPTFKIKIVGARNLSYQNHQLPDAYCIMTLGGQTVGATPVVSSNCHPFWYCDYTINLPQNLNTNSKAFLQLNVYHDNNLGSEIQCGRASVYLKDEKLMNYLTHTVTMNLRPQGSLLLRIRRHGEVEDTTWYVQRTRELLRFTLEDIMHIFSTKITRALDLVMQAIIKATQGRKVFGVVLQQSTDINDDLVEGYMREIFEFIDSTLALFNSLADRRFEVMLENLFSHLLDELTHVTTSDDMMVKTPIIKASSDQNLDISPFDEPKQTQRSIDYRKPTVLARLFWHKILQFCTTVIDGIHLDSSIQDDELRQVQVMESVIEYCKAIFHCKMGSKDKVMGLAIHELENGLYRQLRKSMASIVNLAKGDSI